MKINIIFLLVVVGLSHSAFSRNKRFSLNTNLLNLAISGPSLSLSYLYTPKLTFQVYGSSGSFDKYLLTTSQYRFKTAIFDVKYSIVQGFFEGLYAGPYLRYIDKKIKREGYVHNTGFVSISSRDFHGEGISTGLSLGFQIQDTRFINLEMFGGAGYGKFFSQRDYSGHEKQKGFLDGRVGILVGLKF